MDLNKIIEDKVAEIIQKNPPSSSGGIDEGKVLSLVHQELERLDPTKLKGFTERFATVEGINNYTKQLGETINKIASDLMQKVDATDKILHEKLEKLDEYVPLPQGSGGTEKIIVEVIQPNGSGSEITLNAQHREFRTLMNFINDNIPCYIHGPTGSGKTTATYNVGHALGLKVYRKVLSRETGQHEIFGYMDANGKYVEGVGYQPFVNGGILLMDEVDNGNPNTNTALKMLNDMDECYFPNGIQKKHPQFRIVANANTIGNGANSQYVGRNQQDKAFLNIFGFLQWDYDEDFEATIAWAEYLNQGGKSENKRTFDRIVKSFRDYRTVIMELQINHILSPRNLLQASRMFAKNRDIETIKECIIWRGLDMGAREKIDQKIKAMNAKGGRPRVESVWQAEGASAI